MDGVKTIPMGGNTSPDVSPRQALTPSPSPEGEGNKRRLPAAVIPVVIPFERWVETAYDAIVEELTIDDGDPGRFENPAICPYCNGEGYDMLRYTNDEYDQDDDERYRNDNVDNDLDIEDYECFQCDGYGVVEAWELIDDAANPVKEMYVRQVKSDLEKYGIETCEVQSFVEKVMTRLNCRVDFDWGTETPGPHP